MTAGRLKLLGLLGVAVPAGLVLLAWTQTWYLAATDDAELTVGGDVAAPALPALALATFALVGALAIAGPLVRVVLAVLGVLLGITTVVATAFTTSDAARAVAPAVAEITGVAPAAAVDLVRGVEATPWPVVALVAGVLVAVGAVAVALTSRAWPASGRRYSRSRLVGDPVGDWDALSAGDDPTDDDAVSPTERAGSVDGGHRPAGGRDGDAGAAGSLR